MSTDDLLPINHVRVGDRHRKDFGDIDALALSITTIGLLSPIVVDKDNNLVTGHRRLTACRKLGWPNVPVRRVRQITDAVSALIAERDENTCRKDFTPSEAVALGMQLEELEKPKADERKAEGLKRGDCDPVRANGTHGEDRARTADVVAPAVGLAPRTYNRAKSVVLAQDDPDPRVAEVAREATAEMDATGNVSAAERRVKDAKKVAAAPVPSPTPSGAPSTSAAAVEERRAAIREMAGKGYTSDQIADTLGIARHTVLEHAKALGLTIDADAILRNIRKPEPNIVMENTVQAALDLTAGLENYIPDFSVLDGDHLAQWVSSLTDAIRSLTTLKRNLEKELTR